MLGHVKFRRLAVRTENLPQIAGDLCAEFDEIEVCGKLGVLRDIRERAEYTELIRPALWEHLAWADSHVELANCPKLRSGLRYASGAFAGRFNRRSHDSVRVRAQTEKS
jgi:hypothetical protein